MHTPLAPLSRFLLALCAFGLLYLAGPGILSADGWGLLAVPAVGLWAAVASRPGERAFLSELAAGALGWAAILSWSAYVWPGTLLYMGPGMGLYTAASGWLLRRIARAFPLALAAPAAWLALETVRALLEPPFGFQWMRLGVHLHDLPWLAGSARVWGTGGLSLVVASLGGLLADVAGGFALRRRPSAGEEGASGGPARPRALAAPHAWIAGLSPAALALAFSAAVPPPETVGGPRLLLVQPGIEQARKMQPKARDVLFAESLALTRAGLEEARRAGQPPPDLVAWGETMLHTPVVAPDLIEAVRSGRVRADPWSDLALEPEQLEWLRERAELWVGGGLFGAGNGGGGVLPEGTAFLSGAELLFARDGRIRRLNAVLLWPGPGEEPRGPAGKLHLVPGAETMLGLERFQGVRDVIHGLAGYVPDLAAAREGAQRLSFTGRDGREWVLGASVCFDNAFDDPYTRPVREGGADFHLVVSNEAWFRSSQEMDQMMAFSHLAAIATGRSLVRATNAGVSAVIGPDGREVARLVALGRDREVAGTLHAEVPVPRERAAGGPGPLTPFVRWERLWSVLWIALPLVLLGAALLRGSAGYRRGRPG